MRVLIIIIALTVLITCKPKRNGSVRDRFKESVIKLRNVGLFEDYKNLTAEQLTDSLIKTAKINHDVGGFNDFEEVYDPVDNEKAFDLHVAELDKNRVWWHDLEADICKENLVYSETIRDFGKMSAGYLKPREIKEEWKSDTGPIEISFLDGDTLRTFRPEYNDDWYDTKFFNFLQTSMTKNGSPYKFYMHDETGQDVFVIRVTEDEKRKIETEMNWSLVQF
jgi:hypothetical protein